MKSRIVFLGTAGDSLALAKQRRRGGGFVILLDGGQYHVDPGPGALCSAPEAKISPRETICCVVSNNSLLASGGVNEVVDAMTLGGIDRFGVIICSSSVNKGIDGEFPVIRRKFSEWVERIVNFDETTRIGVNYLNIFPKKAVCDDSSALGFRFETPAFSIGYTGDTEFFEELPLEHKGVDVLVVRMRHPKGVNESGTLNANDVVNLLVKARPKIALLTGFGSKLLNDDLISVSRSIQQDSGVRTIAVSDGFEFDLSSL